MKLAYPAIVHEDGDGCWVEFPDLEGCFTDGETVADALSNASEAMGAYLCSLLEAGQELPAATEIGAIKPENGFTSMVVSDPNQYRKNTRAVKKTLTIPEWLNDEAEKRNINFSAVLKNALIASL